MTRFSEIPTAKFPLDFDRYVRLRDELQAAARGFGQLGTAAGRMVDKDLMEVHARLGRTWELIRQIERRENAE
jgi:hypothetical protein